jgi:hypothetical protein
MNDEPIAVDRNIENASATPLFFASLVPADHIATGPTRRLWVVRRSPANIGSKQVREATEVRTVEGATNSRRQVLHARHGSLGHFDIMPPACSNLPNADATPWTTRSTALGENAESRIPRFRLIVLCPVG